jgi:hypothetical protein
LTGAERAAARRGLEKIGYPIYNSKEYSGISAKNSYLYLGDHYTSANKN